MKFYPTSVTKDADSTLDYIFDFSNWLNADTISSHTCTVDTGLTKNSSVATATQVTAWLAGGTVGNSYKVKCQVVTNGGRTDEGIVLVKVV